MLLGLKSTPCKPLQSDISALALRKMFAFLQKVHKDPCLINTLEQFDVAFQALTAKKQSFENKSAEYYF